MSSYSAYSSHHSHSGRNIHVGDSPRSASPTSPYSPSSFNHSNMSQIYTADYNNAAATTPTDTTFAPSSAGSPTSTMHSAHHPARGVSPSTGYSTSLTEHTRWKRMRLAVMRMATVERLQLLWGLLALFGSMSWMSLMPAYAFWNRVDPVHFKAPVYSFFLVATVSTSLSAIWQSLCPFLTRQSQRALLPRIINHPATQTATIFISVVLTILNFFSWMVLAGNKDYGAKTSCLTGTFAKETGYAAQCRGVNVAIIFDVVVFFLWIPISVVIVCGTIDRGLWWWGEDDGWAQGETIVGGTNMMSEEEFDMKIGMGGKQIKRRQTVHPESMQQQQVIQQPKPAFVTPIASQFRSSSALDDNQDDGEEDDFTNFTPSSYRRHHQQRQQQQQRRTEPRQLNRRGSNTSLSSRLSTFFGAGWNNGTMPPEDQPPMPQMPLQYRQESAAGSRQDVYNSNNNNQKKQTPQQQQQQRQQPSSRKTEESKQEVEEESDPADMHGDSYASQWHSRRYDDWS